MARRARRSEGVDHRPRACCCRCRCGLVRAGSDCIDESALEPGLEWVASALSVASLLSEVKGSTRRVSELVAALRSYSQMDRAAIQLVDITDGIESTLAVLGHRLTDDLGRARLWSRGSSDRGLRAPSSTRYGRRSSRTPWMRWTMPTLERFASGRERTARTSSSRSATRESGCRLQSRLARSTRSTRRSRSGKARGSASTSPDGLSRDGTAARSP